MDRPELREGAGIGKIGGRVADRGKPIIVARQGHPRFLLALLKRIAAFETLPPVYVTVSNANRDGQALDEYLGNLSAHAIRSCAAANRAAHGPYVRGVNPEYRWYQHRDGDGIVCERR